MHQDRQDSVNRIFYCISAFCSQHRWRAAFLKLQIQARSFFFWLWYTACGILVPRSRNQTFTLCSGTTKSQPLDLQGSPSSQIFVFCISVFLFFPRNVSLSLEETWISVVGLIFQHSLCQYLDDLRVRNGAVLILVLVPILPFCVLGLGTPRGREFECAGGGSVS